MNPMMEYYRNRGKRAYKNVDRELHNLYAINLSETGERIPVIRDRRRTANLAWSLAVVGCVVWPLSLVSVIMAVLVLASPTGARPIGSQTASAALLLSTVGLAAIATSLSVWLALSLIGTVH